MSKTQNCMLKIYMSIFQQDGSHWVMQREPVVVGENMMQVFCRDSLYPVIIYLHIY